MKGLAVIMMLAVAGTLSPVQAQKENNANNQQTANAQPAPDKQSTQQRAQPPEAHWQPLENWLKAKGSPLSGKDFYEVGRSYRIDPDFLIAITAAETNLGKVRQRGSACNVGSVGSYDSVATTHRCTSHRQGIEMIAQTLNNQLLGKYSNVGQLSRVYNPSGKVYATGNNWPINVLATLSELKGYAVPPTYQFRR